MTGVKNTVDNQDEIAKINHQTECFFDMSCPFTNNDEEYITLFVKILDDDPNVTSYQFCTIYYNGTKLMDGMTITPFEKRYSS